MPFGGCSATPHVGGDAANVIASIHADVGDYSVPVALVVGRGAKGISHGHPALEIRDDVGFCVLAVKERPDAGNETVP